MLQIRTIGQKLSERLFTHGTLNIVPSVKRCSNHTKNVAQPDQPRSWNRVQKPFINLLHPPELAVKIVNESVEE